VAQKATFFNFWGIDNLNQLLVDIESLATPVLESERVELVDVTYQREPGGWTLCFYLDKSGGITLADCEYWSDRLGLLIDGANLLDHAYSLEVSSPGIERPLKKQKDFDRFKGERVHVKLFAPLDGQKNFHGFLKGADEQWLHLSLDGGRDVSLPRESVAKAKLDPDIRI
jgi:ribosome maturation factor RimP